LLFACGHESPNPRYDSAGVDQRYQAVYNLVQDVSCNDSSVCSCIGIGSRACGGPVRDIVYSSTTVDAATLQAAVEDLNSYEAGYNQQEGIMSICSFPPLPIPSCVNNKCIDLNTGQ
jgi:hypothetical protein